MVTHLLGTWLMVKQSGVSSRPTRQRQCVCGGRAGNNKALYVAPPEPMQSCSAAGGRAPAGCKQGRAFRAGAVQSRAGALSQARRLLRTRPRAPRPPGKVCCHLVGVPGATGRVCVPRVPLWCWWRLRSERVSGWLVLAGPRESPVLPLARWVWGRRSGPAGSPCPAARPAPTCPSSPCLCQPLSPPDTHPPHPAHTLRPCSRAASPLLPRLS